MMQNRSIPPVTIIPVLQYDDVSQAARWLADVFGFVERLRIGTHRIQMLSRDGTAAMVVTERSGAPANGTLSSGHSMLMRVDDVDAHHAHSVTCGVQVIRPPESHMYGERQYSVVDIGGHLWTFSQSIADVDPASWGGELVVTDTTS